MDQIEAVRFHHVDSPQGTAQIDGITMLELWKEVEKRKQLKGNN
jgi:hypothetical protein